MDDLWVWIVIAAALAAAPALIEGAVGLLALTFRLVMGTLGFALRTSLQSSMRSDREATLAKASYGAFMLYFAAFEMALLKEWLPYGWPNWARLGLIGLGLVWLVIGCGWRSRGERNGN